MNHDKIKDDVMAFMDGELEIGRTREVSDHLQQCRECQELTKQWEANSTLFKTDAVYPSERFVQTVMQRIEPASQNAGVPFLDLLQRWIAPVAAGLAFAGYLALMVASRSEGQSAFDTVLISETQDDAPAAWLVYAADSATDEI